MNRIGITDKAINLFDEYGKIILLSGARQVGKTTLAKKILDTIGQGIYVNWDILTDQKKIIKDPYFYESIDRNIKKQSLVIFDEIHKYHKWKNYLKGVYDKDLKSFYYLVTGSGKLDLFKKGGDSLLGRYINFQLFPFTLGELTKDSIVSYKSFIENLEDMPATTNHDISNLSNLFKFSGFPEPLFKSKESFHNIWQGERKKRLIKEDIRDATNLRNISLLEILTNFLPEKVGSLLSMNSLKEDVGVSFETVREWIQILNQFYYSFTLTPFSGSLARTLRKEQKLYLFDYTEIENEGSKFENLIALHLLKSVSLWKSLGEGDMNLYYLRDKEKREVDFVITQKKKVECLIECKLEDTNISSHLSYYQEKFNVPYAIQLVNKKNILRKIKNKSGTIWIVSAESFLKILN